MLKPVKKSIPFGRHTLTLETGEIARQAGGAVMASLGDSVVLVTCVAAAYAEARPGFLSADRRLPGKDLRRGQDPRRLLQARGTPVGEGDADVAPHRPAAAAAVPGRLLQRRADRRDGDVGRSGDRSRHPRAVGASAAVALSGIPFNGPIGAARVGYVDGAVRAEPEQDRARDARSSTSSSPAPKPRC